MKIEDGAFVSEGVVFREDATHETLVRSGARIDSGAVIAPGIEIGLGAVVKPGAIVQSSVPANAIVSGDPAEVIGFVGAEPPTASVTSKPSSRVPLGIGGAALHRMKRLHDWRGDLTVGDVGTDLPFELKRWFMVFGVPANQLRGQHAHRRCHQFLICVCGSFRTLLDDGSQRREVILQSPDLGVYMPPMIWGTQYFWSEDAVLLVFASHGYDDSDYIRNYDDFLVAVEDGSA